MSEPESARRSSGPSWGRPGQAVKAAGLRRHLEGWQLGVLSVVAALGLYAFTTPRPSRPDVLPLPQIDFAQHELELSRSEALARLATSEQLPFDVRAVGEAIRRFGAASQRGDRDAAAAARASAAQLTAKARASHPPELLQRLLAVQTELFARAVDELVTTGRESDDFRELGGDFATRAREHGWMSDGRLRLSPAELRVVFEMRWLELTRLRDVAPFSPSLNDWRVYYRMLLRLPRPNADARKTAEERLALVEALARRDSTYEVALARGVLLFQLGAYSAAADQFRAHLRAHPEGRWQMRARNYLLAALAEGGSAAGLE